MLVNVALAAAFLVHRKKRGMLLIASLVAAVVLQAGRLVDAPALLADHEALLVQENIPVDVTWTRDAFERTLRELTDLSVLSVKNAAGSSSSSSFSSSLLLLYLLLCLLRHPLPRHPPGRFRRAGSWS